MATPAITSVQDQPALVVSHTPHGSMGPAIAVVVVIAVLGVVAGMIGRICAGRSVMGYGHFDVEAWLDTKFSSCIDGHIDPPPLSRRYCPPPPDEAPVAEPDADGADKEEEGTECDKENSHEHVES